MTGDQFLTEVLVAVRRRIVDDRISMRGVAEHTGLSASAVQRFVTDQTVPDVTTAFALADWAGLKIRLDRD